jgi:predicted dehydrogenase
MGLHLGILGIGGVGYLQAKAYAEMDGVSVVAAADVSSEARALFEEEFDAPTYEHYRLLLNNHSDDLDAVTIVTPHIFHFEQAKACLEWGLHVLVEKPMVTDVAHAVELVELADERDLVLQVGYQRHFHPAFKEIRRILQGGRIGDIHTINCYLGQDWIEQHRETWRSEQSMSGGGQLYDTGSHLLDALLWTTGGEPRSVTAQMTFEEPGVDIDSTLTMTLDHDGQSMLAGICISGDGVHGSPTEGYTFWGTEGRLSYADDRISVAEKNAVTYSTSIDSGTGFKILNRLKLENFIGSIEGTAEPAVPGEVGLRVTAVTEAAYQAADDGETVSVPSLLDGSSAV